MTRSKILERLCRFGPPVIATRTRTDAACIVSTRIGIDVLAQFGLDAAPLSVHVDAWNLAAWDLFQELNFDGDTWRRREAFTLSTQYGEILKPIPGRGWIGHLVIHVPAAETLVDLSIGAMSRPARGIPLPDVGTFHWPHGTTTWTYGARDGARLRYQVRTDLGHDTWQQSPDAAASPVKVELVTRIAKAIRANRL